MNRHPAAPVVDLAFERAKAEARDLLRQYPELRSARTAAFLAGEGTETMPKIKQFTQLSLRLPQALVDRCDALVPVAGQAPELATAGEATRADVIRLAVLRGLAELEAELRKAKP